MPQPGGIVLAEYHLQPPSDERAVELLASSADESESIEAYRFDIDGKLTVTDGNEQEWIRVNGQGAVNRSTRRLHAEATGEDDSSEVYVDGYTRYKPCPFSQYSNVENVWYGVGLDRTVSWTSYTTLGELDTLQRISHVYLAGNATVDGTEARSSSWSRIQPSSTHSARTSGRRNPIGLGRGSGFET